MGKSSASTSVPASTAATIPRWVSHLLFVLCITGAVASILFMIQSVWVFLHPPTFGVWRICHWLGEALLFILAGASGCFLEWKSHEALLEEHNAKFFFNRMLLGMFYFWLGCYSVGINNYDGWQIALARIAGIAAWVVSAANLVATFGWCRGAHEDKAAKQKGSSSTTDSSDSSDCSEDVHHSIVPKNTQAAANDPHVDLEQGQAPNSENKAAAPGAPSSSWNQSWSHQNQALRKENNAPEGGWNTACNNPFGTA